MNQCIVCKQDTLDQRSYHDDCIKCAYCSNPVHYDIVVKCMHNEMPVSHAPCRETFLRNEFNSKPVVIRQDHLDMLNRALLMLQPKMDLSVESNQKEIELQTHAWMVDMDLDQKYMHVKRMQAAAAMASIVLSKDPKARDIHFEISKREKRKFEEAEDYRQDSVKRIEERKASIRKEAVRRDPVLKAQDNIIQMYLKMGLSREDAESMVKKANEKIQ